MDDMGEAALADVAIASTMKARLVGLLGRDGAAGVLMLAPCRSIHTYGMRFPIDVAFVAADGAVLAAHRDVPPRRHLRCRGAVATLERQAAPGLPWYERGSRLRIGNGLAIGSMVRKGVAQ